jgi:hypothetical protein
MQQADSPATDTVGRELGRAVTATRKTGRAPQPAERGKRRIPRKPGTAHVRACHPWLVGELDAVRPRVLVALGATAAQALFGSAFRLTEHRAPPCTTDWSATSRSRARPPTSEFEPGQPASIRMLVGTRSPMKSNFAPLP